MNLTPLDIVIVAAYTTLIVVSGILVKKYVRDIRAFLVADRSMGLHLGLASLVSSEIGIITYMYLAEAGYTNGFVALMIGIPFFIVFIFLGRTGFIVRPLLEMKISTIPEFFEKTFGRGVRFTAAVLMAVGGIINFGVFPGVEAKFINTVTGIPQEHLLATMVVLLGIVLLYTALGGMVSVIITNYIQFILLSLGMVFITVLGVVKIGWPRIVAAVADNYGAKGFNPFASGGSFGWAFFSWQLLFQLSVMTVAPFITMRIFSSKDTPTGLKIFSWSSVMFVGRAFIPVFWGVMAIAFVTPKPADPLQALPLMIAGITPRGALGLVFAALLAASMSTYASYLLSWSSVIAQDVIGTAIEKITGRRPADRVQMIIGRATMAFVILFLIWWSFFFKSEGLLFFYLMLAVNLFLAGTLVVAVFGLYVNRPRFGLIRARRWGAYLAFLLGAFPTIWYFLPAHPSVSSLGLWSYGLALVGMVAGSAAQNLARPIRPAEASS